MGISSGDALAAKAVPKTAVPVLAECPRCDHPSPGFINISTAVAPYTFTGNSIAVILRTPIVVPMCVPSIITRYRSVESSAAQRHLTNRWFHQPVLKESPRDGIVRRRLNRAGIGNSEPVLIPNWFVELKPLNNRIRICSLVHPITGRTCWPAPCCRRRPGWHGHHLGSVRV